MKNIRIFIIVIVLLALVLSACAKSSPTPKTAEPVAPPVTAETETPSAIVGPNQQELYPVDETKTVLEKIIFGQHTLDFILREKRTAEEWDKIIDRMIGYGCSITTEQKQVVIDWLVEQQK